MNAKKTNLLFSWGNEHRVNSTKIYVLKRKYIYFKKNIKKDIKNFIPNNILMHLLKGFKHNLTTTEG